MPETILYLALAAGGAALALAAYYARAVLAAPEGDGPLLEVGKAIREGAMVFLRREYGWLAVSGILVVVLIAVLLEPGRYTALAYALGVVFSALAGLFGLGVSTRANVRATEAARTGGVETALPVVFRGAAVMGLTVAGLGLLGIGMGLLLFRDVLDLDDWPQALAALALGAASVALFARIAGGIYAKGADVGSDLAGKAGLGLSGDDPRNPAVVADNVGDNVEGLAGAGADLFQALLGALVAPMAYAMAVFGSRPLLEASIFFPLAVGAVGTVAAGIGTFLVRVRDEEEHAAVFGLALWFTLVVTAAGAVGISLWIFSDVTEHPSGVGLAVVAGLAVALLVGKIVDWHTSDHHKTVKEVARQAQSGPAMVVTSGIAEGMRSAALSAVALAVGIGASFYAGSWALGDGGGIYGVTVAAIGALATAALMITLDGFGPIADNAGGLARIARLPAEARRSIDALESAGSGTRATVRGFGIASSVLTSLALLAAFTRVAGLEQIDLVRPETTGPLLVGAMFPFLAASLIIAAVGRVSSRIVDEVRRQTQDDPRPSEGPDYRRCVVIATSASLREMAIPGSLAVVLPLLVGLFDLAAMGAFLLGLVATGSLLAVFMGSAGGAWQSARMFIETGAFGGVDSESHEATVVGDAVGDAFKDAAGPAVITVVQTAMILALTFASAFAR